MPYFMKCGKNIRIQKIESVNNNKDNLYVLDTLYYN